MPPLFIQIWMIPGAPTPFCAPLIEIQEEGQITYQTHARTAGVEEDQEA